HTDPVEKLTFHEGAHLRLTAADDFTDQPRQKIAPAAVVVPATFRLDLVGQGGGECRDVVLPHTKQHRDHVGFVRRVIADRTVAEGLCLAKAQPVGHAQHLVDGDAAPLVLYAPFFDRYWLRDVQPALTDQNTHQAAGDALGHRPGDEGTIYVGVL